MSSANTIDLETVLAPIPSAHPAGENLRYAGPYDAIQEARRAGDRLAGTGRPHHCRSSGGPGVGRAPPATARRGRRVVSGACQRRCQRAGWRTPRHGAPVSRSRHGMSSV
jgi:hypothetical protein